MSSFVSLTDLMYPVGSYYISNTGSSPASLFGGEWTQLTDLRVLIGWNSAGSTGGKGDHAHIYGIRLYSNTALPCFPRNSVDTGGLSLLNYNNSYIEGSSTHMYNTTMYFSKQDIHQRQSANEAEKIIVTAHTSSENSYPPYRTCFMWYRIS